MNFLLALSFCSLGSLFQLGSAQRTRERGLIGAEGSLHHRVRGSILRGLEEGDDDEKHEEKDTDGDEHYDDDFDITARAFSDPDTG